MTHDKSTALTRYADLQATTHLGPVDQSPRHSASLLSVGTLLLVLLADRRGGWPLTPYSTVQGFLHLVGWAPPPPSWLDLSPSSFIFATASATSCWDAGYGFELRTIYASGWTVVPASTALTVAAWISSFVMMGYGRWRAHLPAFTAEPRASGSDRQREGVEHWWMQRVTAVALIPLSLWQAKLVDDGSVRRVAVFELPTEEIGVCPSGRRGPLLFRRQGAGRGCCE